MTLVHSLEINVGSNVTHIRFHETTSVTTTTQIIELTITNIILGICADRMSKGKTQIVVETPHHAPPTFTVKGQTAV